MTPSPRSGLTAFVLAGGGTKGSFEVGVLQYLVGVEGITPDIITATSAGAIAATVLAQARTQSEFAQRVDEIEGDVLAWTQTEHVFGKQAWLGALEGTALGREIHSEITEGTRPPFPLSPARGLPDSEVVPPAAPGRRARAEARRARRKRQRHMLRLAAGAGLRLPRVRRHLRSSGSSVLNLEPLAAALRHGTGDGVRARRPGAGSPPGPAVAPGRDRAARRRPALRHGGRDDRRGRRPDPRAGRRRRSGGPRRRRHRLGQRAYGLSAPSDGGRRLRRRRGHRDRPGAGGGGPRARHASSPWWPCR